MIIDVHTHVFTSNKPFSNTFLAEASRARTTPIDMITRYADYRATAENCDATICFGGKARLAGLWVDDQDVATYIKQDPARLIGFLSLDPTQIGWEAELKYGHQQLGLQGIKLMPMYAGFYPQDAQLIHCGNMPSNTSCPSCSTRAQPLSHKATWKPPCPAISMSWRGASQRCASSWRIWATPYEGECVAVIRKHPNVYADVSALHYRPWQLFHSLMLVHEYGVWDKLLFGTDFPFTNVAASVAGLRSLAEVKIDRFSLPLEKIEEMIQRDALKLLGLKQPGQAEI